MKWVQVGIAHFNTDLILAFNWSGGTLFIWWLGEPEGPDSYKDPDRIFYNRLCRTLGVRPVEADPLGEN